MRSELMGDERTRNGGMKNEKMKVKGVRNET